MAFPEDPLGLRAEMLIDGAWTDFTKDVYTRDPISHQRGIRNGGAVADPASVPILINNKNGTYSPRNPLSPYYGKIGRNTRVRLSLPGAESYLEVDGSTTGIASTPDTAALDVSGDIDLLWEGETDWYAIGSQFLIGKWGISGSRAYGMRIGDGQLALNFVTPAGASLQAAAYLPTLPRRAAVRATLDTDNGAGGYTARLYWAASITGPWTQVGTDITSTTYGPVTIRNVTAPLSIAPAQVESGVYPLSGRVYRAEVRSGIDGTLVADPDFTAQAAGTTAFTDSAGRAWTLSGTAAVRDRVDRFIGEISEWPQRWVPSEADAWTPVTAAGVLRRLGRGTSPLDSALRRRIPSYGPLAYWPMEDGSEATSAASPITGVTPLALSNADWASADTLLSSDALPVLRGQTGALSMMSGRVPAPATALSAWSVYYIYRLDTPPTTLYTFMRIQATGTVREWFIQSRADRSRIIGRDADGTDIVNLEANTGADLFNQWVQVRFWVVQETATTASWRIDWIDVGGDAGGYGDTYTGTVGRPTAVSSPSGGYASDLSGLALGHISVWPTQTTAAYTKAITGWTGETAGDRMLRLADEESVPLALAAAPSGTDAVGSQGMSPVLDLIKVAADADGGLLTEDQTALRLLYRPRPTLYSQAPALVLDYAQGQIAGPLEPVDDDTAIRNDVTVTRDGGSSGRAVLEEGPLSVQTPPDGVGIYDDSITLSLATDEQTEPKAFWELHLGTWDEPRYPAVTVNLHRHPELISDVLALREGDVIRLTNMPKWVAPDDVDLMMVGLSETLLPRTWTITYNSVPAGPWRAGIVGDTALGIVDTDGTELAAAVDADATVLPVVTNGAPWVWETAMDVQVGGEIVTVTAVTGGMADSFGRTVSGGWGAADAGGTWTVTGTAADYSVGSGYGVAAQPTVNVAHLTLLPAPSADVDLYVDVAASALATGASLVTGLIARAVDNSNCYQARVEITTGNAVVLSVRRRVGGTETLLGSAYTHPTAYTAGAWWRVRFQVVGTVLSAKVWPAASPEPASWQVITFDTNLTAAASIGTRSFRGTGNTTAAQMRFDNFRMANAQAFTVVRSANGVAKAHAAGADVRLARPARVAL